MASASNTTDGTREDTRENAPVGSSSVGATGEPSREKFQGTFRRKSQIALGKQVKSSER